MHQPICTHYLGRLVEKGTHAELLDLQGAYHSLVQTQEEGQVELEEKDLAEADRDNENNNNSSAIFMENEPKMGAEDDELRSSFLKPSKTMQSMTSANRSSRFDDRMSR